MSADRQPQDDRREREPRERPSPFLPPLPDYESPDALAEFFRGEGKQPGRLARMGALKKQLDSGALTDADRTEALVLVAGLRHAILSCPEGVLLPFESRVSRAAILVQLEGDAVLLLGGVQRREADVSGEILISSEQTALQEQNAALTAKNEEMKKQAEHDQASQLLKLQEEAVQSARQQEVLASELTDVQRLLRDERVRADSLNGKLAATEEALAQASKSALDAAQTHRADKEQLSVRIAELHEQLETVRGERDALNEEFARLHEERARREAKAAEKPADQMIRELSELLGVPGEEVVARVQELSGRTAERKQHIAELADDLLTRRGVSSERILPLLSVLIPRGQGITLHHPNAQIQKQLLESVTLTPEERENGQLAAEKQALVKTVVAAAKEAVLARAGREQLSPDDVRTMKDELAKLFAPLSPSTGAGKRMSDLGQLLELIAMIKEPKGP